MLAKQDIYHYDRRLDRYITVIKGSDMPETQKEQILSFKDYMFMRGLSKPRVLKYLEILNTISFRLKKELSSLSKKDVNQRDDSI